MSDSLLRHRHPKSPTARRRWLASLALWLAWPAGVAGPAQPVPVALPARRLRVALRCVSASQAGAMASPAGATPALAPGSVVVGSTGPVARSGAADVSTRSTDAASPAWPGVEVIVANGERAVVRWQVERELPQALFAWTVAGRPGPARPTPTGAAVANVPAAVVGLDLRGQTRLALRQLDVLARWPGGASPVQLSIHAEQPAAPDATLPAPGLAVQTVLSVALDRWTTVARSVDAPDALGPGSAPGALALQVRVSLASD